MLCLFLLVSHSILSCLIYLFIKNIYLSQSTNFLFYCVLIIYKVFYFIDNSPFFFSYVLFVSFLINFPTLVFCKRNPYWKCSSHLFSHAVQTIHMYIYGVHRQHSKYFTRQPLSSRQQSIVKRPVVSWPLYTH